MKKKMDEKRKSFSDVRKILTIMDNFLKSKEIKNYNKESYKDLGKFFSEIGHGLPCKQLQELLKYKVLMFQHQLLGSIVSKDIVASTVKG